MKRNLTILLALVAVVCWAQAARADTIDVPLGIPNDAMAAFSQPMANVNIAANNSVATFLVTALSGLRISDSTNVNYVLIGGKGTFGLNVTGTLAIDPTSFSYTQLNGNAGPFTLDTNDKVDGLGNFTNVIDSANGGFANAYTSLTFKTTTTFVDAGAVLAQLGINDIKKGFTMAADVGAYLPGATVALATGAVGNGVVPLPGAVLLLGAGLVRLAAYARRRKED